MHIRQSGRGKHRNVSEMEKCKWGEHGAGSQRMGSLPAVLWLGTQLRPWDHLQLPSPTPHPPPLVTGPLPACVFIIFWLRALCQETGLTCLPCLLALGSRSSIWPAWIVMHQAQTRGRSLSSHLGDVLSPFLCTEIQLLQSTPESVVVKDMGPAWKNIFWK